MNQTDDKVKLHEEFRAFSASILATMKQDEKANKLQVISSIFIIYFVISVILFLLERAAITSYTNLFEGISVELLGTAVTFWLIEKIWQPREKKRSLRQRVIILLHMIEETVKEIESLQEEIAQLAPDEANVEVKSRKLEELSWLQRQAKVYQSECDAIWALIKKD